jgi:ABC-type nitrate/sulfonate/bicarbonate transport system substrate-binding protein
MRPFKIQPHSRLQEWVAEEKGYFADEGLDYIFHVPGSGPDEMGVGRTYHIQGGSNGSIQSTEEAPSDVKRGAFETMEAGRSCDISAACHWAVNMAASGEHGKMWGHAYSVTPSGIYVAPESSIRVPMDLAGHPIGVGYHSGSHFSALQALEAFLEPSQLNLKFIGTPNDRVAQLLDRRVQAANVFGMQSYIVEQQGFRKVVDTSFMIGFLISGKDVDMEDVGKYFRALQRAQRDIDVEHQKFSHYYLREMADEFKPLVDIRAFGPGERLVFEPYTREVYEQTHRWMKRLELFPAGQLSEADYTTAVVA